MNAQRTACILALVLAIAGVVAVSTALAQGSGNPADIVISEVMYDASIEPSNYNYGEWVEIYNRGNEEIDLAGWTIRDLQDKDVITYSMCPNNSCVIPPKGCWLIARNVISLQAEFDTYANPENLQVDPTRLISLNNPIGNGLANTTDTVVLSYTDGLAVDCVSWSEATTPTFCNLNYVADGNGANTALGFAGNAQSITNIQGQWYYHQPNASPYNCINTAAGGSPTAVILSAFSARPWLRPGLILAGAVGAGAATLLLRRREGKPRRPLRARAGPCARR